MWNDTDVPLAYLISFRCYGTWLHGDQRGSVDRHHNCYKSPYIEQNEKWHRHNEQRLSQKPVKLNASRRQSTEAAIRETCALRDWSLYALNVRTNHVHSVVAIGSQKPEKALVAFKANATRQMREDGCWQYDRSPWVVKGSKRYLWNERSLGKAIEYVSYGQGDDLPDFDS